MILMMQVRNEAECWLFVTRFEFPFMDHRRHVAFESTDWINFNWKTHECELECSNQREIRWGFNTIGLERCKTTFSSESKIESLRFCQFVYEMRIKALEENLKAFGKYLWKAFLPVLNDTFYNSFNFIACNDKLEIRFNSSLPPHRGNE